MYRKYDDFFRKYYCPRILSICLFRNIFGSFKNIIFPIFVCFENMIFRLFKVSFWRRTYHIPPEAIIFQESSLFLPTVWLFRSKTSFSSSRMNYLLRGIFFTFENYLLRCEESLSIASEYDLFVQNYHPSYENNLFASQYDYINLSHNNKLYFHSKPPRFAIFDFL